MYLIAQNYNNHSKHNFLFFFSLLVVAFSLYFLFKNSAYITIAPMQKVFVEEKVISISMITPEPIVEKEVKKTKKKIMKKVIKKKIITKTIKKVIPEKRELVKVVEPKLEQVIKKLEPVKVVAKPVIPTFDAKLKASFIDGLYEKLNEKKYYPKMAKRRKLEGVVIVSFTLCKDGTIKNVFLSKSCGYKILDKAALKVIKSIDFYKSIPDAVSMARLNLNIPIKYSRG